MLITGGAATTRILNDVFLTDARTDVAYFTATAGGTDVALAAGTTRSGVTGRRVTSMVT